MNKKILISSLAAAGLALAAGNAVADADQPWHITGQVGGVALDSDRNTRDNDVWWSVGFGRFFGNNFSLDLEYDEFSGTYRDYAAQVPGATYDEWSMSQWGVMSRYHFGESAVRPFLAGGIDYIKHRNVMSEDNEIGLSVGAVLT